LSSYFKFEYYRLEELKSIADVTQQAGNIATANQRVPSEGHPFGSGKVFIPRVTWVNRKEMIITNERKDISESVNIAGEYPLQPLISRRKSTRAFSEKPVELEKLLTNESPRRKRRGILVE
jgi:hypothetical protein